VLDNTVLAMRFEGGHGKVENADNDVKFIGSHSTENMAILLTRGARGLKHGRHLAFPGDPSNKASR
jgi:hypothetical protein